MKKKTSRRLIVAGFSAVSAAPSVFQIPNTERI
jgi:hypothetical protein